MNKETINLLFVIVLYNQKLQDSNSYKSLLQYYVGEASIYVYDNSPKAQHSQNEFTDTSIVYVSDTLNRGLSFAYNRAAEYAKKQGIEWIMLLDQDTTFSGKAIIDDFVLAQQDNPNINLFVPIVETNKGYYLSPVKALKLFGGNYKAPIQGAISSDKHRVINSGMIINLSAFFQVGMYNERLWLDMSDHDFVRRFSESYKELFVLKSVCCQSFSNDEQSKDQKLMRFSVYCSAVRNCYLPRFKDKLYENFFLIKRTLSLSIKLRTLIPFKILYQKRIRV